MDALKRSRSGHAGAITRIYNKLQKIANDNPTTFDVTHLQRQLEKVYVSDSSNHKIHCEICETYSDEIDDEVEADILDQYDYLVEKAVSFIERLIAIHDVHASAIDLQERVETLSHAIAGASDVTLDKGLQSLSKEEAHVRRFVLRNSTIHTTHSVRNLCKGLTSKLMQLKAQMPATSSETSSSISGYVESRSTSTQVHLPKLSLPTFKGDPMKWSGFWARFRSSVHDNCNLDDN